MGTLTGTHWRGEYLCAPFQPASGQPMLPPDPQLPDLLTDGMQQLAGLAQNLDPRCDRVRDRAEMAPLRSPIWQI